MAEITGGQPPKSDTDCSRLLDRLNEIAKQLGTNMTRLNAATKTLYCPSPDAAKPERAKRDEGWVGDLDTAADEIESLTIDFRTELDWLNKLTGC